MVGIFLRHYTLRGEGGARVIKFEHVRVVGVQKRSDFKCNRISEYFLCRLFRTVQSHALRILHDDFFFAFNICTRLFPKLTR